MSRRGRPVAPLALLVPVWTLSAAAPGWPNIRSAHAATHLAWSTIRRHVRSGPLGPHENITLNRP